MVLTNKQGRSIACHESKDLVVGHMYAFSCPPPLAALPLILYAGLGCSTAANGSMITGHTLAPQRLLLLQLLTRPSVSVLHKHLQAAHSSRHGTTLRMGRSSQPPGQTSGSSVQQNPPPMIPSHHWTTRSLARASPRTGYAREFQQSQ